ncbi:hypothetical protein V7195_24575, partial [Priestia megaterium]|uniref:hypothetical protein n=1 Tax=Priestia megaterium TaxID=1404 RepID=UPI0030090FA4
SYVESGKLFIRVSNVKENAIVTGASDKYITEELYKTLKSYKPNARDILLTKDGTPGVCYVLENAMEGVISGGIVKMTVKENSI